MVEDNWADFWQLLTTRRSVRRFSAQEIAPAVIENILTAATWAPSAHNRQPWRFVVVTNAECKKKLAETMADDFYHDMLKDGINEQQARHKSARSIQRITHAPLVVVLCMDESGQDGYPDVQRQAHETTMAVQGVALAGGFALLAAHAQGLAGFWMCAPLFAPLAVRQVFDLPPTWQPQALLLLGYPAENPPPPKRKPLKEMLIYR